MMKLKILFTFIFSLLISAQALAETTYVIKKGDTLYRISMLFKTEISEIKGLNNLDSDLLIAGTEILIPSAESTMGETLPVSSPASGESPAEIITKKGSLKSRKVQEPVQAKKPEIYTVRKGDSLWTIAKVHSLSVKQLKEFNNLKTNRIKPAQKLFVEKQVPAASSITSDIQEPQTHVVEEIETLSGSPEFRSAPVRERLILLARKMLGIPYRFGSSTFMGIDCSAFVQKAFSFIGIELPRTAREQFDFGEPVDKENLSIGDLVFFETYAPFPSHVGIYLGNNLFIHASQYSKKVTIDNLDAPYYLRKFIGAKRLHLDEVQ